MSRSDASDTILLSPGVYSEHLTIDKSINIVRNPDRFCPIIKPVLVLPPKFEIIPCPTIDGSDTGRVINVSSPSATVNLEKITIQHGAVTGENGAGILNIGMLTLDNVTVRDNAVLAPDVYTESGGGISNQGMLLERNSHIYNNSAYDGGGIYAHMGLLTVQDSEIYNNSAVRMGGGNISSDSSCGLLIGIDLDNTSPHLLPLGNYGGPVMTHALPAGSPAIDFGQPFFNERDARGVATQDGDLDGEIKGDSGAYEFDPPEVYLPMVIR